MADKKSESDVKDQPNPVPPPGSARMSRDSESIDDFEHLEPESSPVRETVGNIIDELLTDKGSSKAPAEPSLSADLKGFGSAASKNIADKSSELTANLLDFEDFAKKGSDTVAQVVDDAHGKASEKMSSGKEFLEQAEDFATKPFEAAFDTGFNSMKSSSLAFMEAERDNMFVKEMPLPEKKSNLPDNLDFMKGETAQTHIPEKVIGGKPLPSPKADISPASEPEDKSPLHDKTAVAFPSDKLASEYSSDEESGKSPGKSSYKSDLNIQDEDKDFDSLSKPASPQDTMLKKTKEIADDKEELFRSGEVTPEPFEKPQPLEKPRPIEKAEPYEKREPFEKPQPSAPEAEGFLPLTPVMPLSSLVDPLPTVPELAPVPAVPKPAAQAKAASVGPAGVPAKPVAPAASPRGEKQQQLPNFVVELVYWRDPKKSGIVFGSVLGVLLSLTYFSLISVVAYLSLALLTGTICFRIYKNVLQAVQKTSDGHPFKDFLGADLSLPQDKVLEVTDVAVSHVNAALVELRRLFLVEDLVDSIKFAVLLWCLTYVGAWFNGMTLVIISFVALFTLPKVYEQNKIQIDQNLELVRAKIADLSAKVKAAVPLGKKPGAVEEKKDQ
ncbi:reticulon-1-like isoform X2 [Bacillus rossius redtenbacheri]|uniref:reticulon-1-like isoform X2 n=1 Tax=Bacillus rossius redtenbacheri TaxID=93214 RepID=UPI002FDE2BC3